MKGIIFDLDGVIVFTDRYHYQAWKMLADKYYLEFDETINNQLRGVSRMESLEIILRTNKCTGFSNIQKATMAEEKNRIYRSLLQEMTPDDISPEVRDTLKTLKEQGFKLAIGSSSKNTKFILERTNLLNGEFDAISDGTNITRSKPDPEVFLKAADMLGLSPEDCAVVEDARSGIDAACNANMVAIAIGEDAGSYEKSDYRLHSFHDLLSVVNEINGSK